MFLARVTGTVVATVKDEALFTHKLLVVRPLDGRGRPQPRTLVALDAVGAGVGETVYCCRGKEASFPWLPVTVPSDASIVGIVDPAVNPGLIAPKSADKRDGWQGHAGARANQGQVRS